MRFNNEMLFYSLLIVITSHLLFVKNNRLFIIICLGGSYFLENDNMMNFVWDLCSSYKVFVH